MHRFIYHFISLLVVIITGCATPVYQPAAEPAPTPIPEPPRIPYQDSAEGQAFAQCIQVCRGQVERFSTTRGELYRGLAEIDCRCKSAGRRAE